MSAQHRIRGQRAATSAGRRPRVPRRPAHPWPDEDVWRGLRADARQDAAEYEEAMLLDEEPATEDGGIA